MRLFSRFQTTALVTAALAALALGACASDEDLTADPTASDEAALAQQDDQTAAAEAPVAADAPQALASSLGLSFSCPCEGFFAHCEGEAFGGTGTYVIKFHGLVIPNHGGFFQFGSGMNHGTVVVTATSGGATVSRSYNVSCQGGGGPNPL
jgi:hypothetical protein